MRRAAKIDDNQKEIVKTFRAYGCSVKSLAAVGEGFPDLCIGYMGKNWLVEVKDGSKPPSKRALTPQQQMVHAMWDGTIYIVESVEDVMQLVALWKSR